MFQCQCGVVLPADSFSGHIQECEEGMMEKMQTIGYNSIQRRRELNAGGEEILREEVLGVAEIRCTVCGAGPMSKVRIVDHILNAHPNCQGLCPICASQPWGNSTYICQDLWGHVEIRHWYGSEGMD